jgi:hypothetical protein
MALKINLPRCKRKNTSVFLTKCKGMVLEGLSSTALFAQKTTRSQLVYRGQHGRQYIQERSGPALGHSPLFGRRCLEKQISPPEPEVLDGPNG